MSDLINFNYSQEIVYVTRDYFASTVQALVKSAPKCIKLVPSLRASIKEAICPGKLHICSVIDAVLGGLYLVQIDKRRLRKLPRGFTRLLTPQEQRIHYCPSILLRCRTYYRK